MIKAEIQSLAAKMKTVEELALLLNAIRQDEFGITEHPITAKQLYHFANPKIATKRYKTFQIRKKSGGMREINAPSYQLGIILYILNILLKSTYTPSKSAMGFAEGRSVVDNAQMHVGHHYVFNIDLKDFFPSIPQARVWARLQVKPFGFSREIANVVAGLCCHTNSDNSASVLPQGAPTSPLLTNAICDRLDHKMRGVSARFGLHYSRYADDMTFSSMHNVYQEDGEFRKEVARIIDTEGFKMNENKTRLLREGQRQEVTGLTVNETVNVSRKYISDLRWLLNMWEREGYAKAYAVFYPKYKHDKGYIKKGEPVMENVIGGKLDYMRMVRGESNDVYRKLRERYDRLQTVVYQDNETDEKQSYTYVQQYTMTEFCELFATRLSFEVSHRQRLVGKCVLAGMDKTLAISVKTQTALCPDLQSRQAGEEVSIDDEKLAQCYVTLCRAKGKNFWLITNKVLERSKCFKVLNLNANVDNLLNIWKENGLEAAVKAFTEVMKGCADNTRETEAELEDGKEKAQTRRIINDFDDLRKKQMDYTCAGELLVKNPSKDTFRFGKFEKEEDDKEHICFKFQKATQIGEYTINTLIWMSKQLDSWYNEDRKGFSNWFTNPETTVIVKVNRDKLGKIFCVVDKYSEGK